MSMPAPDPRDEAAIRQIVTDVQDGFNGNDAELMSRHFAPDALVVSARGAVQQGRAAIDEAARAGLAAGPLRDATAHYRVTDVAMPAPDVALVHKDAWSTRAAAEAGEPPAMNALYVLVRRDGRWWIVRRQNTLVG